MSNVWLEGPVTTAVYGWRLERADGVTLGFTSHDRDIWHDGLLLRASPGLTPSSIGQSLGLEHDALDMDGALASEAITEADLMAGRWDSARLDIFLLDWSDPDAAPRLLMSGTLGAVSLSGQRFSTELLGPTVMLERSVVPSTSPGCRAHFCDSECGLSRTRFTHRVHIASAVGTHIALDDELPSAPENLRHGTLRWLDGPNCGLTQCIAAADTGAIRLAQTPAFEVAAGALVELAEGCDRQITTCANRFGNAINFRGEPYLPGNDLLTRYPGGL